MSTRSNLRPQPVIVNGSMAGNLISAPTVLQSLSGCSYSASWVGTAPVGTLSVQVSNDYSLTATGQVNNPGTWNTLTLSVAGALATTIPVTGSPGNDFIDILKTEAYAIRLIYTATSGTGTMQAIFNGKVS